jgi:hypothetical protein
MWKCNGKSVDYAVSRLRKAEQRKRENGTDENSFIFHPRRIPEETKFVLLLFSFFLFYVATLNCPSPREKRTSLHLRDQIRLRLVNPLRDTNPGTRPKARSTAFSSFSRVTQFPIFTPRIFQIEIALRFTLSKIFLLIITQIIFPNFLFNQKSTRTKLILFPKKKIYVVALFSIFRLFANYYYYILYLFISVCFFSTDFPHPAEMRAVAKNSGSQLATLLLNRICFPYE